MLYEAWLGYHQGIHSAALDHNCKGNLLTQVVRTFHSQTLLWTSEIGHRKKWKFDSNHRYSPDICRKDSNISDQENFL